VLAAGFEPLIIESGVTCSTTVLPRVAYKILVSFDKIVHADRDRQIEGLG